MSTARPIDLAKWHEWAERLGRLEGSIMSVCAWCRQARICEVQFSQWGRKLAALGCSLAGTGNAAQAGARQLPARQESNGAPATTDPASVER